MLIQRVKAEQKTASGILLPEKSVEKLSEGLVVSVGEGALQRDGKSRIAPSVKAGDKVLLPAYGGSNIKVGEDEYTLFRDSELLAVINE